VARSRESSATRLRRQQWEQDRQKLHREEMRKLKEELEREGFPAPAEGFDEVNLAVGDSLYKHGRSTSRATAEIVLDDEDGPYAADRRAGRRSSVMVPGEINSKFPLAYCFRRNQNVCFLLPHFLLHNYVFLSIWLLGSCAPSPFRKSIAALHFNYSISFQLSSVQFNHFLVVF